MIHGYYHDVVTDAAGRVRWESGWRSNRIVRSCDRLLAALMKGNPGIAGVLYWAVGNGRDSWDAVPLTPRASDTRLASETARKQLTAAQIVYLDEAGNPTQTITDRLEVSVEFTAADLAASGTTSLREFGLFGGDATASAGSGFMIDYVIHPRIDLDPAWTLKRKLQLSFGTRAAAMPETQPPPVWSVSPQPVGTGFGTSLPVLDLDGVGNVYASVLEANGIHVLGDLIALDPSVPVGTIPRAKLWEFRAKARMVTGLQVHAESFTGLADRTVISLLDETAEAIAEAAGPGVMPEQARELQEAITVLLVALDDATLEDMTVQNLLVL